MFNIFKSGVITKTKGLKGELYCLTDFPIPKTFDLNEHFFIEHEGLIIPFNIEYYKIAKDYFFIVKLKQINSINEAKIFINDPFYLDKEILNNEKNDNLQLLKFINYYLKDISYSFEGTIKNILIFKNNSIAEIITPKNKSVLIPFNKQFIKKIDKKNKVIYLKLPSNFNET